LAVGEIGNLLVGRPRDKLGRRGAHHQQAGLEIAARVRNLAVAMHAVEGAADFDVADHEGAAVGEESDHRNDAEHDDAGANRQFGEGFDDDHWTEKHIEADSRRRGAAWRYCASAKRKMVNIWQGLARRVRHSGASRSEEPGIHKPGGAEFVLSSVLRRL
jgi:hypothetical protein